MATTTPLTDAINSLTTYSNSVTGASDTDLSSAVATLVAGYGGGGASNVAIGTFTGTTTTANVISTGYTGNGYPVAFFIYSSNGSMKSKYYGVEMYAKILQTPSVAPAYSGSGIFSKSGSHLICLSYISGTGAKGDYNETAYIGYKNSLNNINLCGVMTSPTTLSLYTSTDAINCFSANIPYTWVVVYSE